MPADVIDRSVIRKQFAALLATELAGVGKPAEAVYAYQTGDFKGKSPVLVVTSAGSDRASPLVASETVFFLEVYVFVLYALEDGTWTEEQSEDRLDLLEKGVADVVIDANDSDLWQSVATEGQSITDGIEIGGDEYRYETITIRIVAWDN